MKMESEMEKMTEWWGGIGVQQEGCLCACMLRSGPLIMAESITVVMTCRVCEINQRWDDVCLLYQTTRHSRVSTLSPQIELAKHPIIPPSAPLTNTAKSQHILHIHINIHTVLEPQSHTSRSHTHSDKDEPNVVVHTDKSPKTVPPKNITTHQPTITSFAPNLPINPAILC